MSYTRTLVHFSAQPEPSLSVSRLVSQFVSSYDLLMYVLCYTLLKPPNVSRKEYLR